MPCTKQVTQKPSFSYYSTLSMFNNILKAVTVELYFTKIQPFLKVLLSSLCLQVKGCLEKKAPSDF